MINSKRKKRISKSRWIKKNFKGNKNPKTFIISKKVTKLFLSLLNANISLFALAKSRDPIKAKIFFINSLLTFWVFHRRRCRRGRSDRRRRDRMAGRRARHRRVRRRADRRRRRRRRRHGRHVRRCGGGRRRSIRHRYRKGRGLRQTLSLKKGVMFFPFPGPYTHHYAPVRIVWLKAVPYRFYPVKNYWKPTVGKKR